MKIAVNVQHLLKDKLEGIGWFAHETLSRITRNHPEHEFLFIFDREWDPLFVYADNVTPVQTILPSRHPLLWVWHYEVGVYRILKKYKPDLFFSPDGWMSLRTNVPTIDVIHDINFVHRPDDFPFLVRKYYNFFFPRFAKKSKQIITVSEYSKTDMVNSLAIDPAKIDVAYNGCNAAFTTLSDDVKYEIRKKFTSNCPYFIYIGSRNPRKNIQGLLEAFEQFKQDDQQNYKLLFVGEAMWKTSYLSDQIDQMLFKKDVLFTGRLSTEALQLVLASAQALVLVSFSEGFGIPVVEAMQCDVPVICSNVASLPEVAGDAALYVDPISIDQITDAMTQMSTLPDFRERLIEKGRIQRRKFSWDLTAEKVWETIEKMLP